MIKVAGLTKKFEAITVIDDLSLQINEGSILGLVGSNGAGKSTLLRLITGIYKPDVGKVMIEGHDVYENTIIKDKLIYVPDELYFIPQATMERMTKLYSRIYKSFSYKRYESLVKTFGIDTKKVIEKMSKGTKRQAAIIIALSCMPKYLLLDETFDGLDISVRSLMKKILYSDVCEKNINVIITSHSLRELEDTCDQIALLHKGKIRFEADIQNLKTAYFKIQVGFDQGCSQELLRDTFENNGFNGYKKNGMVASFNVCGDRAIILNKAKNLQLLFADILTLTLEEVVSNEMESLGYTFNEFR